MAINARAVGESFIVMCHTVIDPVTVVVLCGLEVGIAQRPDVLTKQARPAPDAPCLVHSKLVLSWPAAITTRALCYGHSFFSSLFCHCIVQVQVLHTQSSECLMRRPGQLVLHPAAPFEVCL